jgi:hypothetical protein
LTNQNLTPSPVGGFQRRRATLKLAKINTMGDYAAHNRPWCKI